MSVIKSVKDLCDNIDTSALIARPLSDWRPVLAKECSVFVCGETYLAKRFDSINYKFCDKDTAKDIVVDNLYALLRFKYFPKTSEEIDDRIAAIVKSFVANLKTTLHQVSFSSDSDANFVKYIPDYCVAFRNGVYNFKDDCWFFKYDIINIEAISNTIYLYDNSYIITWYLDYDFESLPISLQSTSLEEFINIMKTLTSEPETKNYCFELMYNIAHNQDNNFDIEKFKHLAQILGYTMLQSFSQYFVFLIGAGQNGKNSLFDGCFTNKLIPRPASNSLESIEQDRFITGSLENRAHNIFLETSPKTYTTSTVIKSLTGSMYQTIENKGINKYSGIINCKFIFSGNDQDRIKFSDTTHGFKRRINMFEISYIWDSDKKFMKKGDYYDTTFSDSLVELTSNKFNTTAYVYLAMYGIMLGTENFTKNFKFLYNDWNTSYNDIDFDMKERIEFITVGQLLAFAKDKSKMQLVRANLFDEKKHQLIGSRQLFNYGFASTYEGFLNMLQEPKDYTSYFSNNDIYMSMQLLKELTKNFDSKTLFTLKFKQCYNISNFEKATGNKSVVRCTFVQDHLKILK